MELLTAERGRVAELVVAGTLSARRHVEDLGDGDGRHPPADWELAPASGAWRSRELASPWPIARHCSTRYRAQRSSGRRRLEEIGLLVVHCTQSDTAAGAASWFANPASRGSAHVVVDGRECFRTLPPSSIPWGAPGANGRGWHLELAGRAEWSRPQWLARRGTLERGAYKLALHAKAFEIPLARLTVAALNRGARGVVDHRQCSSAFGGSHWDVGDGFPWDVFLARARHYRKGL
jgi:hypothetical protein